MSLMMFSWSRNSEQRGVRFATRRQKNRKRRAFILTEHLDLPEDALGVHHAAECRPDVLDGHVLVLLRVAGGVHDAVGAAADLLRHLVVIVHDDLLLLNHELPLAFHVVRRAQQLRLFLEALETRRSVEGVLPLLVHLRHVLRALAVVCRGGEGHAVD